MRRIEVPLSADGDIIYGEIKHPEGNPSLYLTRVTEILK